MAMIRSGLESFLNRHWYGGPPPWWLRALEGLYRTRAIRRQAREAERAPMDLGGRAIIVVGNVTIGGTGKTPLIIRLCELLASEGLKPGVVSRGYGRRGTACLLVDGTQPVQAIGDEPRLIYERCGVPVAVCANRVEAARRLFAHGVEVILSDDGLQHARLPRFYEICVIDGQRGLGNGHLLPAGPLREDPGRLATVDAVVINASGNDAAGLPAGIPMRLAPGQLTRLSDGERVAVDTWVRETAGEPAVAMAGIGNPARFFQTLETLGIPHRPCAFADHHEYTASDFEPFSGARIIMTEKDAVKCRNLGLSDAWYLPVTAVLPESWERAFCDEVRKHLEAQAEPGGA